MALSEDSLREFVEETEGMDDEQLLVFFGEQLSLSEGSMGAVPLRPSEYKAKADAFLREKIGHICEHVRTHETLRKHVAPTSKDFFWSAVCSIYDHLDKAFQVVAGGDHVGLALTAILAAKHGFQWLCAAYGGGACV